jgi:hypothetical protein
MHLTLTTHASPTFWADAKKKGRLVMTKRARAWKQVTQKIDIAPVMQEFILAKRAEHSPKTARW